MPGTVIGAESVQINGTMGRIREERTRARELWKSLGYCRSTLARMCNSEALWEEAEKLGVEVIETTRTELGVDHSDALPGMNNILVTYNRQW